MKHPNLIVLGGMKCGSTSLHNYLNEHPDIFMSDTKELDFFIEERNWQKGQSWYKNQFQAKYPVRGESSQNYTKKHLFKGVPKRIESTLSNDTKFIFIARDPIKRLISHLRESISLGFIDYNFQENFKENLHHNYHVRCSMYYYQLKPYYELFGSERIKVITLEELQKYPLETMNELFVFLGVPKLDESYNFRDIINSGTTKKRQNGIGQSLRTNSILRVIKDSLSEDLKLSIKQSRAYQYLTTEKVKSISLDDFILNEIREILIEDTKMLPSITTVNIDLWDTTKACEMVNTDKSIS